MVRKPLLSNNNNKGSALCTPLRPYSQGTICGTSCEFCGMPAKWVQYIHPFMVGHGDSIIAESGGAWLACDHCKLLLQANKIDELAKRSATAMISEGMTIPFEDALASLWLIHSAIYLARVGLPKRLYVH